jgi:hypothetical protein
MNYEYNNIYACHNLEAYKTMGTYYGEKKCHPFKGLDTLAIKGKAVFGPGPLVEGFDYGNCNVVVPTEKSMSYGKIFNHPKNSVTYRGYFNVPDGYYPAQSECGDYRMRKCI